MVDALAAYRGVPRGIYRAAKRNAAAARAEASAPLEVQTEQWIASEVAAAGDWQNLEPFTDMEWGLERDELLAAIERIPFVREREIVRMVGLEGMAQSAAGERFGIQQAAASKALKSGFEMLRELLEIGSALDVERVPSTLEKLRDLRQRRAIALLYGDRIEPERAREALRMGSAEFRKLHHDALRTLRAVVWLPPPAVSLGRQ